MKNQTQGEKMSEEEKTIEELLKDREFMLCLLDYDIKKEWERLQELNENDPPK